MATYKSAKKQLAWTMQVLDDEISEVKGIVETYSHLLENAQTTGNESDIDFWFEAFQEECTKLRVLEDIHFRSTHPEIYNENMS